LPVALLMNQVLAPMVIHLLMRPAMTGLTFVELPDIQQTCDVFADAFVRAAAVEPPQPRQR
jgi:hypothetical protein